MKRLRLAIVAAALGAMALPAPTFAFHHRNLPANECGQSSHAGGANPTARAAIVEHNPAQGDPDGPGGGLPIPPAGTPGDARTAAAPAHEDCANP